MYRIGIDVGSTYTKYCVVDKGKVVSLFSEKSPIRQKNYFEEKIKKLYEKYPRAEIISCGYGKRNVDGLYAMNELVALARGAFGCTKKDGVILDIGGQDTKIVVQRRGELKEFFVNDKCAAGSGMFLAGILEMLNVDFYDIDLSEIEELPTKLISTCAVFAQSEVVELITDNRTEREILAAIIGQILVKAKPLLGKMQEDLILISGGFSQIKGIAHFAKRVMGAECFTVKNGSYLAAIGCAI